MLVNSPGMLSSVVSGKRRPTDSRNCANKAARSAWGSDWKTCVSAMACTYSGMNRRKHVR